MLTNKNIISEIDNLILIYAEYDKDLKQFELTFDDLPEHEQENLVALIMINDPDRGYESLGIDNPNFAPKMLPALINLLKNSIDPDNRIDFIDTWRSNLSSYFRNYLNNLIQEQLSSRLFEEGDDE